MIAFFPYLNDFRDNILNQGWYFKSVFIIVMAILIPMTWGLYQEVKSVLMEMRVEQRRREFGQNKKQDD